MPKAVRESKSVYTIKPDELNFTGKPLILKRNGKPYAAVIPIEAYKQYRAQIRARKPQPQVGTIEAEREAFYRLKPELLKTHRGLFVAMVGGKVVDSDADDRALVKRVQEKFGNVPIYVQLVSEHLRVVELPSPEIVESDEFWQGFCWFQDHRRELLKTHRGKWVAVLAGQVVDFDDDKGELARRAHAKFPERQIYFTIVQEQPRVVRMPSFRVVREQ
jgi:hypothetical protein